MIFVSDNDIQNLNISPATCVEWVKEAFLIKKDCQLPTKVHVHPQGDDFITTMPCLLPPAYNTFGVKVVSRIAGRTPSLMSNLTLYDAKSGEITALMDSNWITNMRTGAVAALSIKTLRKHDAAKYAFMGLGQIAKATMKCLAEITADETLHIRLLRYKDQAEKFRECFSNYPNLKFEIVDNINSLVKDADVVVSAITSADGLIVSDPSLFAPGTLLVPVHTRGFQNCDTVFDAVFGDDYDHIKGFKHFNQFKSFTEIADALSGFHPGRMSDMERIISYNYGIALHDVFYANKIYNNIR